MAIVKIAVKLLLLLVLVWVAFADTPVVHLFNQQWIEVYIRDNGTTGIGLYVVAATGLLSIGLTSQLVAFFGGYAFGAVLGVVYSMVGATLSCMVTFLIARWLARPFIQQRWHVKIHAIDSFLQHSPFVKTVIIRLLPVGSNLLTNLIGGTTAINILPFVAGSAVGYLPQMIIFALMGKGVVVSSASHLVLSVVLMAVSVVASLYLYRQHRVLNTACDSAIQSASLFTKS